MKYQNEENSTPAGFHCGRILIYGYGNPGRQDDALGFHVVRWCEEKISAGEISAAEVECNYQLNVEDSLLISEFDTVIFADATTEDIDDFRFTPVVPEKSIAFSTHAMDPGSVLALCTELYDAKPETWLLSIRGYEWDLGKEMTSGAETNLKKTLEFLEKNIF